MAMCRVRTSDIVGHLKDLKEMDVAVSGHVRRKALLKVGWEVLRDTLTKTPTVPKAAVRGGTLRRSGSVHVEGKFEGDTSGEPGPESQANQGNEAREKGVALIGFNTPYAAKVHNSPEFNFSEPGSGANYLRAKLLRYGLKYNRIAGLVIGGFFSTKK